MEILGETSFRILKGITGSLRSLGDMRKGW